MARLILKSPYIKSTGGAAGYLRYIATRERVEILPDDRPPTRKQEQLIAKLVKDFPDTKTLYEYASYQAKPTKAAASAFLTLALESNWDALPSVGAVSEVYRHPAPGGAAGFPRSVRRQRRRVAGKSDGGTGAVHRKCMDAHPLPQAGGRGRVWASTTPRRGKISSAPTATRLRRR